jgi:hypothetical protein
MSYSALKAGIPGTNKRTVAIIFVSTVWLPLHRDTNPQREAPKNAIAAADKKTFTLHKES